MCQMSWYKIIAFIRHALSHHTFTRNTFHHRFKYVSRNSRLRRNHWTILNDWLVTGHVHCSSLSPILHSHILATEISDGEPSLLFLSMQYLHPPLSLYNHRGGWEVHRDNCEKDAFICLRIWVNQLIVTLTDDPSPSLCLWLSMAAMKLPVLTLLPFPCAYSHLYETLYETIRRKCVTWIQVLERETHAKQHITQKREEERERASVWWERRSLDQVHQGFSQIKWCLQVEEKAKLISNATGRGHFVHVHVWETNEREGEREWEKSGRGWINDLFGWEREREERDLFKVTTHEKVGQWE